VLQLENAQLTCPPEYYTNPRNHGYLVGTKLAEEVRASINKVGQK
jgi:hypothetical protein